MADSPLLPEEFSDLEPFAVRWVRPTANERCQLRLESSMSEMQAFYDAAVLRGDAIFAYLDSFPYEELPEQAVNLLWLMCALSVISFSVDVFKQPGVIDADGVDLPFTVEPVP